MGFAKNSVLGRTLVRVRIPPVFRDKKVLHFLKAMREVLEIERTISSRALQHGHFGFHQCIQKSKLFSSFFALLFP